MSFTSRAASILAISALVVTTACSDSMTGPSASADLKRSNGLLSDLGGSVSALVNSLIPVKALMRSTPVTTTVTRSVKFTQAGGSIQIAELGLRVDVPQGAIPRDTMTIIVTAVKGRMIAYDFQPHGTQFRKPLVFRQDLTNTTWGNSLLGVLNGGYFKSTSQLNQTTGTAMLDELLPAITLNRQIQFNINHFSGYMVSSGRQSARSEEAF